MTRIAPSFTEPKVNVTHVVNHVNHVWNRQMKGENIITGGHYLGHGTLVRVDGIKYFVVKDEGPLQKDEKYVRIRRSKTRNGSLTLK